MPKLREAVNGPFSSSLDVGYCTPCGVWIHWCVDGRVSQEYRCIDDCARCDSYKHVRMETGFPAEYRSRVSQPMQSAHAVPKMWDIFRGRRPERDHEMCLENGREENHELPGVY